MGFTITEVLVVLGVVGLVLALLLPAVQRSREAARRITCQSNLRQIGLANQQYLDSYGYWPPSLLAHLALLPGLEQSALFPDFATGTNRGRPTGDVAVYLCPSDPYSRKGEFLSNYLLNGGTLPYALWSTSSHGGNGMYGVWRPKDVVDGLSSTAFYSERLAKLVPPSDNSAAITAPVRYSWELPAHVRTVDELAAACRDPAARALDLGVQVSGFDLSMVGFSFWYDHVAPPGTPQCGVESTRMYTLPAASEHSGVVNVLLVDGAVRSVSNSISLEIWRALGTRAEGEPVGEF